MPPVPEEAPDLRYVAELVRAAGSDHVRGDDNIAMLGLDLACAVRLAQR